MVAGVGLAAADPLAAARSAKARVDYEQALAEVDRALEAGGLPPTATREALALRAEFLAVLGRSDQAIDAFVELLAVDPQAHIDPGLAPRVRSAFAAAAGRAPTRVAVSCTIDDDGTLSVRLDPGSSKRVRFVRVDRATARSSARSRDQVTPPSRILLTAPTSLACFAVDERGNALLAGPDWDHRIEWSPASAAAPVGGEEPDIDRSARPLWRNPWLWGGAALAAAAGGATFAWLASRDQDRLDRLVDADTTHQYADAEAVLERGRSRVRWSRGLFIASGVLAAGALTFTFWPRRRSDGSGTGATVGLAPSGLWVRAGF
jgi:hypothetical protein